MRNIIILLILIAPNLVSAQTDTTSITGVYKGHPLYIQNKYDVKYDEFCIEEVYVNNKVRRLNLNLSAIKLNFKGVGLFTPVSVRVIHGDSCTVRFVNPDAILYHSSFKFDSLSLNDSIMHWYTKGDRRDGLFIVEKLQNEDYWEEVKRIRAKGRFDGAQYVYFPEHEAGGNKYRIRYELPNGRFLYSKELEFSFYPEPITFSPKVVQDEIILSRSSVYEILDSGGNVILRGQGDEIPLRLLKPGDYSIVLEGQTAETFIKK